jgi:hypothetical protein
MCKSRYPQRARKAQVQLHLPTRISFVNAIETVQRVAIVMAISIVKAISILKAREWSG